MIAPLEARGAVPSGAAPFRSAARRAAILLAALWLGLSAVPARSGPYIWDEDADHIDDRIESVHLNGFHFAFEGLDSLGRKRIAVDRLLGSLVYSVYVHFGHTPNDSDLAALTVLGMPTLHRFEAVPAVRSVATFLQVELAAILPGVERIEAVPLIYPLVHEGAAAIGVRDPSQQVFPTAEPDGADGAGVVIAFLDTGINDAPDGGYPGHESLAGRCLGGGTFLHPDSLLNTPRDGSVNPVDRGGALTGSHGTHVASIALGSGGATGYAIGVAPGARFVDVKVLNDLGFGFAIAEALDWCIHNRDRDWGVPGYQGIDVVNLSLSSLDMSDGNDITARIAARAVELGMVVIASMGNEGLAAHVPSPASGDRVLAVGAIDVQRTPLPGDDLLANFANTGPRASDGDLDAWDEQKPDLLAPGVAVLAADGDLASDGAQYQRLSGTSMAAGFVSGAVARLRSADPGLDPDQIAELLRATAWRDLPGAPPGAGGVDPRWGSTLGYGVVDLLAAEIERVQPSRSQLVRLELTASATAVTGVIRTQRERGAGHFVFERAPDLGGAPGAFAPIDSLPAAGDGSLADADNRGEYSRAWTVPAPERGVAFWYRASFTEGGIRHDGPARRFTSPIGPPAATLELAIVHNAYDHDVAAAVEVGGAGTATLHAGGPALVIPVPGSGAAISSDWVNGAGMFGNVEWKFVLDVPAGVAESFLPPSEAGSWRLRVHEGGFLNRSGRITGFRLIWHHPGGDLEYSGGPLPQPTLEGATATVRIPVGVAGVGPASAAAPRLAPNPARAGGRVRFFAAAPVEDRVRIYDVHGREVGRAPFEGAGESREARWTAADASGHPLPSGVYFARFGRGPSLRLVLLDR